MSITITLPEEIERELRSEATASGKPVEEITIALIFQGLQIQKPARTLDEILAPFRQEVTESGITDEELDAVFMQARRDYAQERRGQE